jgi:two-component system response regulator AtoC
VKIFSERLEKAPALRVLIVDDEPLIRWSMSETLTQTGHTVSEAPDAKETLRRLALEPTPDVILLDYRLPDSNDLELLETIRRIAPRSSVVMMTAFGTPAVQAGALELGAFRVMTKPLEMSELSALVQQAYQSGRIDADATPD